MKLRIIYKKLSKLVEKVPPEYNEQFKEDLLKNSISRLKILSVFLLCNHVIKKTLLFYKIDTYGFLFSLMSRYDNIFRPYIEYGFFAVPLLFLIFTGVFSGKKKSPVPWICCYFFVFYYYTAALLNIFFADSTLELVSLFTIILFLVIFIPDFRLNFIPPILFYIASALTTLRFQVPYITSLQYVLFFIFIAIILGKTLHYNSRVLLFVNTLKMKELNAMLESLAITDELTKLNNRRAFMNYLEIIWKQANRLELQVSVIMIDIDFFKKYNDTLGHLEGDKALVAVAQCLKHQVKRETDFVARFGGEEFVCLLPYIRKSDAKDFAKELVKSVENMKIPHPGIENSQYLTISAGMASIVPGENNLSKQLLDEADKALYEAKQSGRNRAVTK